MSLKRIVVVGTTGSGKTTMAGRLSSRLGIPHTELDALNWGPNWQTRPQEEFRTAVDEATRGEAWVVDGNYSRAREIVEADPEFYRELLSRIEPGLPWLRHSPDGVYTTHVSATRRFAAGAAWRTRRLTGKLMSTARWFKALATFEGGLDYAAWKLERHSGVKIHVSEKMRRRPWLYVWGELIRLYRRGVLR